jgi:HEAT repeat protein
MSTPTQGRPRTVRGVALTILALVFLVPSLPAVDNPVIVAPAAKENPRKAKLRYNGKSFDECREMFLTEISPESRQESLKALSFFARHGYAAETVAAILEMAREYDDFVAAANMRENKRFFELNMTDEDSADDEVIAACLVTIRKAGLAGLPAIREGLRGEHLGVYCFIVETLCELGPAACEVLPELVALTKSKSPASREFALRPLARIGEKDPKVADVFQAILKDGDPVVRAAALRALQESPGIASKSVPAIIHALHDRDVAVCEAAIGALGKADAGPQAVPALGRLLRRKDVNADLVYAQLKCLGAQAKDAVPMLLARLERAGKPQGPPNEDCMNIVDTLAAIGPSAADAVPALKRMLRSAETAAVREPAAVGVPLEAPPSNFDLIRAARIRRALEAIQQTNEPPHDQVR